MALLLFDHGGVLPIRSQLAANIFAMLSDLILQDGDVETAYGPMLTEVKRIPLEWDALQSTHEGVQLWMDWLPKKTPAVALEIGRRTFTPSARGIVSDSDISVTVYVISGQARAEILGRYTPDTEDNRQDPGLDALEDMVESRLLGQSPGADFQALQPGVFADVLATGAISVRGLQFTTGYRYNICKSRDAVPVDGAVLTHDHDEGGIIATQQENAP